MGTPYKPLFGDVLSAYAKLFGTDYEIEAAYGEAVTDFDHVLVNSRNKIITQSDYDSIMMFYSQWFDDVEQFYELQRRINKKYGMYMSFDIGGTHE